MPPRRTNTFIRLTPCRNADKTRLLASRLEGVKGGGELYRVRDAVAARALLRFLKRTGRDARMAASEQTEDDLLRTAAWFRAADNPALIVAEPLPPPLDRPDVRRLFIMNLPPSLAAAASDLDAAGGDGLEAEAEIFASESDRRRRLEALDGDPAALERLNAAVFWLEHDGCARSFLNQNLYGETTGPCGNCGWCLGRRGAFLPPE